jgi:hypothetical protein
MSILPKERNAEKAIFRNSLNLTAQPSPQESGAIHYLARQLKSLLYKSYQAQTPDGSQIINTA